MRRRKLIIGLILLNALLATAFLTRAAETQIIPRGLLKCCKYDTALEPYCCRCCWITWNCNDDDDCTV